MNKVVITGIIAGVLIAGFIFAPFNSGGIPGAAAQVSPQPTGVTKKVLLVASEKEVQVAPDNALHPGGVTYNAMVWNGTIPGPIIAVDQGDTLEVTVRNDGQVIHSLDLHAAIGPSQVLSGNVKPGESKTWTLHANTPGAFIYHCGADGLFGVWEHMANGMNGAIVVHPQNEKPAKEFYLAFGEIYSDTADASKAGSFDLQKFLNDNATLVLTNGMAHKYVPSIGEEVKVPLNPNAQPFKVKPGELTRWYVLNYGPNDGVAFHFISGMLDAVRDGAIKNRYGTTVLNDETWWIPPGSASVVETTFPEEGVYVGVDHAMKDVYKGGALAVIAANNSTLTDQPPGTAVAPKGSESVVASNSTLAAVQPLMTGNQTGTETATMMENNASMMENNPSMTMTEQQAQNTTG
ncbi:MAG TPA: multicopper oxidase domain-containing protein [Nitrososphaeraceae archaeon]|jgi:nitrite reductase (NO-forming)|nr:multicopper oxidase domain-containing protein [Nitrososphaeraceae archaeon]